LRSLWRALALAWLGGSGSPMLSEEPMLSERLAQERRALTSQRPPHARPWLGHRLGTNNLGAADQRRPLPVRAQRAGGGAR
jgi:hypothetical protein